MPGDYTRFTFAPGDDHIGVLMQQGRVLLDADFNELVEILERRIRAGTLDTFGRCVVPRTTPAGFEIGLSGGMLTIGRGRIYVDGILAENHGLPPAPPAPFDPVPAEPVGTDTLRYDEQPYLPDPPALPGGGGPHLVYVDVWQREVTHLEEEDLLEKAVGVDSATRLQTVWQVKVLADPGQGVTCATPDDQIPGWAALTAPPAARLTVRAVGVPADTDPCVVSPSGGFRGTENRLYRVEVHQGGAPGAATFKWSRDNASIAAAVLEVNAARTRITVSRTARDAVLRFSPDDWVEVLDDRRELAGLPGEMRRVVAVDDVAGVIELATALPAGAFDASDAGRHTRVRRWDQKGLVRDEANNLVADVDASGGVIPVPAAGNVVLEDGIRVELTLSPAGGAFRTGDYWVFAARTVDASVEDLTQAPPRGIHHHYCRLAVYTPGAAGGAAGQPSDCRVFWPPECECEGGCDCTVCVTAESHDSGTLTLQMAVDRVIAEGGGKVCVGTGVFELREPLRVQGAQSLRLEGRGWRTVLQFAARARDQPQAAIEISGSIGVEVASLTVFAVGLGDTGVLALAAHNVAALAVERCLLVQFPGQGQTRGGAAVGLGGLLAQAALRDNVLFGTIGIMALSGLQELGESVLAARVVNLSTYALGLYVEDNQILAAQAGVLLSGATSHLGDTRVAGNSVYLARRAAITLHGLVAPWARVDVTGNEVVAAGDGIVFGTDNTRVAWNDVGAMPGRGEASGGSGIVLEEALDGGEVDRAQVIGNRVSGVAGTGIRVEGRVGSAMVKQNVIDGVGGGGILMGEEAEAGVLTVENNQLLELGAPDDDTAVAAIRLFRVRQGDASANTVAGFARASVRNPSRVGIEVEACDSVRLAGNRLGDVGPAGDFSGMGAGILVLPPFARVEVVDNSVRRSLEPPEDPDGSAWTALWIGEVGVDESFNFATHRIVPAELVFEIAPGITEALVAGRIVRLATSRGAAGVRGNVLEAYGSLPTVLVRTDGNCTFSENQCTLQLAGDNLLVARVAGDTLIVGSNLFERRRSDRDAVDLRVQPGRFTVLGNVSSGRISVNGAGLPPPWNALNVTFL